VENPSSEHLALDCLHESKGKENSVKARNGQGEKEKHLLFSLFPLFSPIGAMLYALSPAPKTRGAGSLINNCP